MEEPSDKMVRLVIVGTGLGNGREDEEGLKVEFEVEKDLVCENGIGIEVEVE